MWNFKGINLPKYDRFSYVIAILRTKNICWGAWTQTLENADVNMKVQRVEPNKVIKNLSDV